MQNKQEQAFGYVSHSRRSQIINSIANRRLAVGNIENEWSGTSEFSGTYIPCGIVDEDNGQLHIIFGSSYKTSDFIVDNLIHWWKTITPQQRQDTEL